MAALVDQAMCRGRDRAVVGPRVRGRQLRRSTTEVVALARVAARHGGFYISHIRDEADLTLEAVREAIAIGEQAKLPVQITHIKLGTVGVWGKAAGGGGAGRGGAEARHGRDRRRLSVPGLALEPQGARARTSNGHDPASVKEALDDVGGGRNIQITRLPTFPQYVGKRLDEIARAEGISEVDALHPHRRRRRRRRDRPHDDRRGPARPSTGSRG